MTATISLADLADKLDEFLYRRVFVKKEGRVALAAVDADFVAWFAERDVTLVVDRDTVTHERITLPPHERDKFDMIAEVAAERGIPVIDIKVTEMSPESVAGLPAEPQAAPKGLRPVMQPGGIASVGCVDAGEPHGTDYTLEAATRRAETAEAEAGRLQQIIAALMTFEWKGAPPAADHNYTLEVTIGNQRHSFMLSQRYASEDMAKRDYTAAASIKRLALVRHTPDASEILRSWEPL